MTEFTKENDDYLNQLIGNNPELYDPRNASYKLTFKKEVIYT